MENEKNTSSIISSEITSKSSLLEEQERLLEYFHSLLFSPAVSGDVPEFVHGSRRAEEIAHALLEFRNALRMASTGDFSYKITTKGFIGGALKSLQSSLNHVGWLTRRVADGDLDQRMDFMGDFADSFNSMVERLSSTLDELKRKQENLESLTKDLRREVEVRKETEKRLREEEERWQLAVQCSRDGIWEVDLETDQPPYYSPRLLELTGISPEDALSCRDWIKLFHPDDHEAQALFSRFFSGNNPPSSFELDHKLLCGDGNYRWFMTRGMLLKNPATHQPSRLIGVTADIQGRKEREELFSHRATHDVLTELPNRALFDDRLKNNIEFAKRNGSHVAVIMLDLDNFKNINDTMGHHAGDMLLVEIADRLQRSMRESDMVSRFGGDEFALIMAFGKNEWQSITKVLNRTMLALKKPIWLEKKKFFITASMGLSICPEDGDNAKELMAHADEALYHAKSVGRNACAFWKPDKQYTVVKFNSAV